MMKNYDYIEGTEFDALMPHALKSAPGTVGASDISVHTLYPRPMGCGQLEVVDILSFYDGGGQHVIVPDVTPNTPEQDAIEENIIAGIGEGTKTFNPEGVVNNFDMPSDATVSPTINAEFQNGATITNNTGKYVIINHTGDTPIDISIECSGSTTSSPVYLRGKFNNIYVNGKSLPVSSSIYPDVYGKISVENNDKNESITGISLTVNFVGDDASVEYYGTKPLTINDGNTAEMGSPTIYAPNATVTMSGKYTDVTASTADDTLKLNGNFHAVKLTVLKGNLFVNGVDINDFVDELDLHEGCVVTFAEYHVSQDNYSKLMSSSPANGKVILDTDIEVTKGRQYGVLASGKEVIDLNGHSWKCGDSRTGSTLGSFYLRGTPNVTIEDSVGGGSFENNHDDYLIWTNATGVVVNIKSGEFAGYTHTLYAYEGTINVYGGTFKLLDAATADRDVNGNLKFLLNCYDANYTAGTAKINVYGGKFYEFNPAVSYSEPGGPVSFVPEGYHVVESIEDEKKVYEVVKDEE